MPVISANGRFSQLPAKENRPGRVRIVKDVLRVGTWKWSGGEASFKAEDLAAIAESFAAQKTARILRPLQWDHSDPETNHASTDQVVTYLSDAWVEGETLWVAAYVTPEEAETLTGDDWPVSVHVVWNSQDQLGQTWPLQLLHVAIVDQPSMPGQARFAALAAGLPKENTLDLEKMIAAFNKLLNAIKKGAKLPEGIDENTFPIALDMAVAMITGEAPEEEKPEGEEGDDASGAPVPPEDAALGARLRRLEKQNAVLGAQLAVLQGAKADDAKQAFVSAVGELIANGTPASSRDALLNLGKANEWDTACLAGFNTKGVALGAKLKGKASADPPNPEPDFKSDLRKQMATAGYSSKEIEAAVARL